MFKVFIGGKCGGEWSAEIAGCPRTGIEAIDFRQRHGLPLEPSNKIKLPALVFEDEPFVRSKPDKVNADADLDYVAGEQYVYHVTNDCSGTYSSRRQMASSSDLVVLSPEAIYDYLAEPTPEAGKLLLLDMWAYSERSKAEAEERVAMEAEQKRAARELMAGEIAELAGKYAEADIARDKLLQRLTTVSDFLAKIPESVIQDTARAMEGDTGKILEELEEASSCYLFDQDD